MKTINKLLRTGVLITGFLFCNPDTEQTYLPIARSKADSLSTVYINQHLSQFEPSIDTLYQHDGKWIVQIKYGRIPVLDVLIIDEKGKVNELIR